MKSTTRLHSIADRATQLTLDMYVDPKRMVEDISALGLRHVGYGIPGDLFGAFVTGCVQVVRSLTDDDLAEEAFRWSLSLISRISTRVINEGSTIVMKAINLNFGKQLRRAVGCAPRSKRALWMLNVQVGTQSISPLRWAIETGSLEAGSAIITDLLTIRADRECYYYGMETLFERHPDIIKRICQAIEWITDTQDPKIVCHPVLSMVSDVIWGKVATRTFLYGKTGFVFTLIVFVLSQSILSQLGQGSEDHRLLAEASTKSIADPNSTLAGETVRAQDGRPGLLRFGHLVPRGRERRP